MFDCDNKENELNLSFSSLMHWDGSFSVDERFIRLSFEFSLVVFFFVGRGIVDFQFVIKHGSSLIRESVAKSRVTVFELRHIFIYSPIKAFHNRNKRPVLGVMMVHFSLFRPNKFVCPCVLTETIVVPHVIVHLLCGVKSNGGVKAFLQQKENYRLE